MCITGWTFLTTWPSFIGWPSRLLVSIFVQKVWRGDLSSSFYKQLRFRVEPRVAISKREKWDSKLLCLKPRALDISPAFMLFTSKSPRLDILFVFFPFLSHNAPFYFRKPYSRGLLRLTDETNNIQNNENSKSDLSLKIVGRFYMEKKSK